MITATTWYLTVGAILMLMGLAGSAFKRLPCSSAMFYLVIGYMLGPSGSGLLRLSMADDAGLMRILTEVVMLISLFAVGLRTRVAPTEEIWGLPVRLGTLAMALTVLGVAALGMKALDLSPGAAILLGAILAPTDPVLAHDVQLTAPGDVDSVRFTLSGEGGLNDGTAYPCAMLGLLLLQGDGSPWHVVSWGFMGKVAWGVGAGLATGWLLGGATSRLVGFYGAATARRWVWTAFSRWAWSRSRTAHRCCLTVMAFSPCSPRVCGCAASSNNSAAARPRRKRSVISTWTILRQRPSTLSVPTPSWPRWCSALPLNWSISLR